MSGCIAFRPVGALDFDRAAALHRQAFEPLGERPWTPRDMAELLASPGVAGLFLEIDGRQDGFALWRTAADEAELLTIAVDANRRGHGHGRALLGAVAAQARRGGARNLFLEVGADNAAARALYSQVGFVEVGRRPDYYQRHTGLGDALVLRLTLIAGG
jgi:ribosomal-protein-alanine N-acetyltransferase